MQQFSVRSAIILLGTLAIVAGIASTANAGSMLIKAGPTLLSRQTSIHIVGKAGADIYDTSDGTTAADHFANSIENHSSDGIAAKSSAHQESMASTDAGVFGGGFAEGSITAGADRAAGATATGDSRFDLIFRVSGMPVQYSLGGAIGASGDAFASVVLSGDRKLTSDVAGLGRGDGATINRIGVLEPGQYTLSLDASGKGILDGSSAYYSVNFSLSVTDIPTSSIPLPPAVWQGLSTLVALGSAAVFTRQSR